MWLQTQMCPGNNPGIRSSEGVYCVLTMDSRVSLEDSKVTALFYIGYTCCLHVLSILVVYTAHATYQRPFRILGPVLGIKNCAAAAEIQIA